MLSYAKLTYNLAKFCQVMLSYAKLTYNLAKLC